MRGSQQSFKSRSYVLKDKADSNHTIVHYGSSCGVCSTVSGNKGASGMHSSSSSSPGSRRQWYNNSSQNLNRASQNYIRFSSDERRHWINNETFLSSPSSSSSSSAGFSVLAVHSEKYKKFILVSYNILGVDNASQHWRELYWHIPSFIMDWNFRKQRILFELGLWSPDIICLQEVDRYEDLQDALIQRGYDGVYKGRTGGSTDGCAIFWRNKKFSLLQEESIEYEELDLRHNVAQLCVLQTRQRETNRARQKKSMVDVEDCSSGANRVVVCNIHVLYNPNRGDIKLGQVRHLLEQAYSLSQEWGGIPVVVAGDFNSIPQSPLYEFLRDSVLDISCFHKRSISGQIEVPRIRETRVDRWTSTSQIQRDGFQEVHTESSTFSTEWRTTSYEWTAEELQTATGNASETVLKHALNLQSAYSTIKSPLQTRGACNEPLVTTYHGKFMGTVDYIWFTEGLVSTKVLEILPIDVLHRTRGLPSKKWGSDHLALACEFAFVSQLEIVPRKE